MPKIILASTSPNRRLLLDAAGAEYEVASPGAVREKMSGAPPERLVVENALAKARAVAKKAASGIIVGADTIVVFKKEIFGKPADGKHAGQILSKLAGNAHEVVSGVAVVDAATGRESTGLERTKIFFKPATPAQIREYAATGEPMGAAGAYKMQGKGAFLVEKMEGSYSNVMGLPLEKLSKILEQFGVRLDEKRIKAVGPKTFAASEFTSQKKRSGKKNWG